MEEELSAWWAEPIQGWLAWLRVSGRSEQTLGLRMYQIRRVARAFPDGLGAVTPEALVEWLAGQTWGLATLRSHVTAICSFLAWAERNGLVSGELRAGLPRVAQPRPLPKPCPMRTLETALAQCDPELALALRLAGEAGLRRGELARVHSRDLMTDLTGMSLRVHGKGAKERVVPLPTILGKELVERLEGDRWLFPGNIDGHVSPAWLGKRMARTLGGVHTAHSLRHLFATRLYGASHDLFVVQRFLGHSRPETTMGYVALADDALRQALDLLPSLS
jgi:integrase